MKPKDMAPGEIAIALAKGGVSVVGVADFFWLDREINGGFYSIRLDRNHINRFKSIDTLLAKIDRMFVEAVLCGESEWGEV